MLINSLKKILNSGSEKEENAREKVKRLYGMEKEYNPFLNKEGEVFNKYINYQGLLNSNKVNNKTKAYIEKATGLTPVRKSNKVDRGNISPAASDGGILDSAKKYIGTPYVWGGESMQEGGMDCSGFVYNALKDAGIDVERKTAEGYRKSGISVSKSELQPGDLIFFGKNNSATHVGIYAGNGQMIHSSGGKSNTKSNPGKGVSVANIDSRKDFIEAKRY